MSISCLNFPIFPIMYCCNLFTFSFPFFNYSYSWNLYVFYVKISLPTENGGL
nr:MAG TPA: hypothetical protein [Caudoviricetes sp.]